LEKQLHSTDTDQREKQNEDKGWHQWTQLSSILDQKGQKLNSFQCESALCSWRCSTQASKKVWDEPRKHEPPPPNPRTCHWTTNTRVNLDFQHTSSVHHPKLPKNLWKARVFPAYKESYVLLKVTTLLKNSTDNECAKDITRTCSVWWQQQLSSSPGLTVSSWWVRHAGVHRSSVQLPQLCTMDVPTACTQRFFHSQFTTQERCCKTLKPLPIARPVSGYQVQGC